VKKCAQAGQAMIEMAIGVTLFLTASLGAVQLGISALSLEAAQSAALVAARAASSAPVSGQPFLRLAAGQAAAVSSLDSAVVDLAAVETCAIRQPIAGGCGLPQECAQYAGEQPISGTLQSCFDSRSDTAHPESLGPSPSNLDGRQNPDCHTTDCFGSSRSMDPCAQSVVPGRLFVCLAYTSWPATAVDVWIKGTLRTLVPLASSAGLDALPVSVQLRLPVEALVP
jgi:hypothetical protein